MEARLKEAAKLGFARALGPAGPEGSGTIAVSRLGDAIRRIGEESWV
jgi:DNA repair protein RadA/Sms